MNGKFVGKNYLIFTFTTLLIFCLPAEGRAIDNNGLITRANQLWQKRSDVKKACNAHYIYLYLYKKDHSQPSLEKSLRSCYWCSLLMKYSKYPKKLIKNNLIQCRNIINQSYASFKSKAFVHFWKAVIYGMLVDIQGFSTNSLKYSSIVKKEIKKTLKIDEKYYYGGPYRFWGKVIVSVPKFLLIFTEDNYEDSLYYSKKALKVNDSYLYNLLYYADVLKKTGRLKEARDTYIKVINTSPDILPAEIEENKVAIQKAKEKLNELEKR